MKKIFSLMAALALLVSAHAGERLTFSHEQLIKKAPITMLYEQMSSVQKQKASALQAGDTIKIVCDSFNVYAPDEIAAYGKMQIFSANDDYSISIITTFTQYYGTYPANVGITPKGKAQILINGEVTLSDAGQGRAIVTSTVTAPDGTIYSITLRPKPIVVPECQDTITIDIPNARFTNMLLSQDAFRIEGKTEGFTYAVSFYFTKVGGKVAGTYSTSQLYTYYSFVVKDPDFLYPQNDVYVEFVDGDINITTIDKTLTLVANLVGNDAKYYKITMTAPYDEVVHLDADAESGDVNRTYTEGIDMVVVQDFSSEKIVSVEATAQDGTDEVAVAFICNDIDKDILIPVGTYPINTTNKPGTMIASNGIINGLIYPSYYSALTDDGRLTQPIYFMVGGKAVVENNNGALKITIDAVNSYNIPIHIVINARAKTAIDQVNADAVKTTKFIKDGQLYIQRNDNVYTPTGALVE